MDGKNKNQWYKMKKPHFYSEIIGWVFFYLSIGFAVGGFLQEILPIAPHSVWDPREVFFVMAGGYGLFFFVERVVDAKRREKEQWIAEHGKLVQGEVTRVEHWWFCRFGNENPYVLRWTYSVEGKIYEKRSPLFWEQPREKVGEKIAVYIHPQNPASSVLGRGEKE